MRIRFRNTAVTLQSFIISMVIASSPQFARADATAPINWAETLRDSLTLNNKPKSKDAVLAAQKNLTTVAKDAMLPSLSSSYGFSQSPTHIQSSGDPVKENIRSQYGSVNFSWTIFQCGRDYYNFKAAQVSEKIMADQFNSTQFFIPNTKGGVVASAFQAYETLVQLNDILKVFPMIMEYFEVLKPIAARDPDAQASLQITVQQTEDVIVTLQQAQQKAIDVFKHWVTVEPGPGLYTLQQAIDELEIPPTWEDAYQIATQKSPDVRQASEQIEMVKDQIKAARAALCPQIEVNASYGLSKSFDGVSNLGSRVGSTQAGFGVTVNLFNKAGRDVLKYQRATLHANELAKQAAEDDAQYSLRKTYRDLENQLTNQKSQAALLQKLIRNIKNSELDIKNQLHLPDPNTSGAVISFITSKLGILNNLGTTWNQLATTMSEILQDKFSVLQAEGTLFDSTN